METHTSATPSFPCVGVNLQSIKTSSHLSSDRKDTLAFGFAHVIREGLNSKSKLLCPVHFAWDNERYGVADGVITSGVGASSRADWLVYLTPPYHKDYRFSTIRDVACEATATEKGATCSKCSASRTALLRRITQTADLRRGPLCPNTNNCYLARSSTLMLKKVEAQADQLKKLRSSYRGKLYSKWSRHQGINVKTNSASDLIFSDETASNLDVFMSKEVS